MRAQQAYDVIRFPVNTEKARLGWNEEAKGRRYTFEVDLDASKEAITRAVEKAFQVKVAAVRTMRRKGKLRKRRYQLEGYTSRTKRAIVTLEPGEKIAFFDGI